MAGRGLHPDRRQARRRDHRGPWRVVGRLRRQRRDRPRVHLGQRHRRGRLDLHGHPVGRLLRRPGGPDLLLPGHHQGRHVRDRPGPGHQRVLPCAHRRVGEGAVGGARGGPRPRPHLTVVRPGFFPRGPRSGSSGAGPTRVPAKAHPGLPSSSPAVPGP
ncbi:hypothetical protein SGPA1_12375 [Streptomyces misionensis JCM 4497]